MTGPQGRWSVEAVDTRLADPDRDLGLLAVELGLPAGQVRRFANVRDLLLTARAGRGLRQADLAAAGTNARDVIAYLRTAGRIRELAAQERSRAAALVSRSADTPHRPRGGLSL